MSFFGKSKQAEPLPRIAGDPITPRAESPHIAPPPATVGFETVLGANSAIEGSLRSNANVRLDGTFTGELEIGGNVLVGETAKITADINARNISIAGAVRGNVSGKKVQLLRTGRIWGDIRAQALTTEEGAFIDGKITMVGSEGNGGIPTFEVPHPQLGGAERITAALTPEEPPVAIGATNMIEEGAPAAEIPEDTPEAVINEAAELDSKE
ncbi:MAG: polymer-forming cytoskeletal protein [Anaerolineae bacterium]|nr:polymer-forming cytoskeletal protein [Anaerolineae bacterium]